jgi:hypothetical protein
MTTSADRIDTPASSPEGRVEEIALALANARRKREGLPVMALEDFSPHDLRARPWQACLDDARAILSLRPSLAGDARTEALIAETPFDPVQYIEQEAEKMLALAEDANISRKREDEKYYLAIRNKLISLANEIAALAKMSPVVTEVNHRGNGEPEAVSYRGFYFDRHETLDALCGLLAEARALKSPPPSPEQVERSKRSIGDPLFQEEIELGAHRLLKKNGWTAQSNFSYHSVKGLMQAYALQVLENRPASCGYPNCGCDADAICDITKAGRGMTSPALSLPQPQEARPAEGEVVERAAKLLYEREAMREAHCAGVISRASGNPVAPMMEPWDECKDSFLGDAKALAEAGLLTAIPKDSK